MGFEIVIWVFSFMVKVSNWTITKGLTQTGSALNLALGVGRENRLAVKLCRSYSSSFGPSLIRQKPHSFIGELCLLSCSPLSIQHKVRLHLMVMSGWERGFLLPLFSRILPFSSCESPNPGGPPYSSLRVWLESQTNPDFHHFAGNCGEW